MAGFTLPALTVAAAALLARSGVPHLHHRRALRRLLDRQALLPTPVHRIVAVGLGPVELTLAVTTVAALVGAVADVEIVDTTLIGGATAALGAAFAVLLLALARTRPTTPCGCGGVVDDDPDAGGVGPLDALRAGIVLAGGLALAGPAATRLASLDAVATATVLVAGLALAAVVDVAARIRPGTRPSAALTGAGS